MGQIKMVHHLIGGNEKRTAFMIFLPKMSNLNLIMRKYKTNPNSRRFYKTPVLQFSKVSGYKIKERQKNYYRLKMTRYGDENATCGSELDPFPVKNITRTNGEISIWIED